jgi:hypothetical protein
VVKTGFCQRDLGQTNEQQHHFNEWPISELLGEVDSIQTTLKPLLTTLCNGMPSLSGNSGFFFGRGGAVPCCKELWVLKLAAC